MCWQCDHPDGTVAEYLDELRATMREQVGRCSTSRTTRNRSHTRSGCTNSDLPNILATGVIPSGHCTAGRGCQGHRADGNPRRETSWSSAETAAARGRRRSSSPMRIWIWRSRCTAPKCGRCSWFGVTMSGHWPVVLRFRRGSRQINRCSASGGLRTRSGGTAPCSAASKTPTSPWPSPDRARTRRRTSRSRTATPTAAAARRAPLR